MIKQLANDLFFQDFSMPLIGTDLGRRVTVVRFGGGDLLIHSTAEFRPEDIAELEKLGKPRWIVEATEFHDTFAQSSREAFPKLGYYAPPSLAKEVGGVELGSDSSGMPWGSDLQSLRFEGAPKLGEHAFFHQPSRTLILADLVFNLLNSTGWERLLVRYVSGVKVMPGMSRLFKFLIKDRKAFLASMNQMMEWDFDRIIVAHGEIIESGGREKLRGALERGGFKIG